MRPWFGISRGGTGGRWLAAAYVQCRHGMALRDAILSCLTAVASAERRRERGIIPRMLPGVAHMTQRKRQRGPEKTGSPVFDSRGDFPLTSETKRTSLPKAYNYTKDTPITLKSREAGNSLRALLPRRLSRPSDAVPPTKDEKRHDTHDTTRYDTTGGQDTKEKQSVDSSSASRGGLDC